MSCNSALLIAQPETQPETNMRKGSSALVLFSGGQDSTVCLAHALNTYEHVETVGFTYGQRHAIEMAARLEIRSAIPMHFPKWAKRLGADHILDMPALAALSETAMTPKIPLEIPLDSCDIGCPHRSVVPWRSSTQRDRNSRVRAAAIT